MGYLFNVSRALFLPLLKAVYDIALASRGDLSSFAILPFGLSTLSPSHDTQP